MKDGYTQVNGGYCPERSVDCDHRVGVADTMEVGDPYAWNMTEVPCFHCLVCGSDFVLTPVFDTAMKRLGLN